MIQIGKVSMSDSIDEWTRGMRALQASLKPVKAATDGVVVGGTQTKFADLCDSWDHVRSLLSNHGFAVNQPHSWDDGRVVVVTIVSHESSGQFMAGQTSITMMPDDSPQNYASAHSYCRRIGFGSILGLTSTDDEDRTKMEMGAPPANDKSWATSDNKADKLIAELKTKTTIEALSAWRNRKGDTVMSFPRASQDKIVAAFKAHKATLTPPPAATPSTGSAFGD